MIKSDMKSWLLGAVLTSLLVMMLGVAGAAGAQTDTEIDTTASVEDVAVEVEADFSDEGLGDDDLTMDLEAEALPTTDGWGYRWENWKDGVIGVFTFNSERKAEHMRSRLHKLDRKMEACAEIGDPECAEKIEERMEALQERTEKYIAKREELKDEFQDRFEAWREKREEHRANLELKLNERKAQRAELLEERKAKREDAKENRAKHIEERKAVIEERHEERKANKQERKIDREQNREHLIEVRSPNLKNRLDDTRLKVNEHDEAMEQAIGE